jgi:hypothetical protein
VSGDRGRRGTLFEGVGGALGDGAAEGAEAGLDALGAIGGVFVDAGLAGIELVVLAERPGVALGMKTLAPRCRARLRPSGKSASKAVVAGMWASGLARRRTAMARKNMSGSSA